VPGVRVGVAATVHHGAKDNYAAVAYLRRAMFGSRVLAPIVAVTALLAAAPRFTLPTASREHV